MEKETKPRKWLLIILIIITIAIATFLAYKGILGFKKIIDNQRKNMNEVKENINKNSKDVEESINKIKEEAEKRQKEYDKENFNRTFEFRAGSQYEASISFLLDDVIKNNKQKKERLINVIYGNINTTDPEEIKNLKKSFEEWHKYEVSVDYNEEGYINKITIEY